MADREIKPFPGVREFLFEVPLYSPREIKTVWDGEDGARRLLTPFEGIRGHCPFCHGESIFHRVVPKGGMSYPMRFEDLSPQFVAYPVIACQVDKDKHVISFIVRGEGDWIIKIGQWPSFADIAQDESKKYRKVLKGEDSREFHRAIGLAAAGVGIGSFVYLRRVFERLINGRLLEHKDSLGVTEEQFRTTRMDEKVELLRDHLPRFLIENKAIYGVISRGIHELSEHECLSFFDFIKESIVTILEDDERQREDRERRKKLAESLAAAQKAIKDRQAG